MMDNGLDADIHAIARNVDEAEVVTFYFRILGKTLLIDTRSSEYGGPMVRLVPIVDSPSERLRSLRRLRPDLPRPNSITLIPWNRTIESLISSGVWDHIVRRFEGCAEARAHLAAAARCLERLRALERRELRCAITGERYEALWSRTERC